MSNYEYRFPPTVAEQCRECGHRADDHDEAACIRCAFLQRSSGHPFVPESRPSQGASGLPFGEQAVCGTCGEPATGFWNPNVYAAAGLGTTPALVPVCDEHNPLSRVAAGVRAHRREAVEALVARIIHHDLQAHTCLFAEGALLGGGDSPNDDPFTLAVMERLDRLQGVVMKVEVDGSANGTAFGASSLMDSQGVEGETAGGDVDPGCMFVTVDGGVCHWLADSVRHRPCPLGPSLCESLACHAYQPAAVPPPPETPAEVACETCADMGFGDGYGHQQRDVWWREDGLESHPLRPAAPPETPEPAEGWRRRGEEGEYALWMDEDRQALIPLAVERALRADEARRLSEELTAGRSMAHRMETYVLNLLARIFRDGGQRAATFPSLEQAVDQADAEASEYIVGYSDMERERDAARAEAEEMRAALLHANTTLHQAGADTCIECDSTGRCTLPCAGGEIRMLLARQSQDGEGGAR